MRTNIEVATLAGDQLVRAHELIFSPNGKGLACTVQHLERAEELTITSPTEIKVWDLVSREVRTLDARGHHPSLVGFVPESDKLVSADGNEMHLWDVRGGKRLRSIPGGYGSLSPDGKALATWDPKAKATRLWEVPSGKELVNLGAAGVPTFHPDSETVATVAVDAVVRLWDRKTGQLRALLDPYAALYKKPHDQIEPQWKGHATPREFPNAVEGGPGATLARFSPDGETLATPIGQERGGATLLWSARGRKFLFRLDGAHLSFSADSKRFATLVAEEPVRRFDSPPRARNRSDDALRVWEVASGKPVFDVGGTGSRVLFTPDGTTILRGATMCDARTGREQGALTGYAGGGLAFTLDGQALVSVSGEKATLWDVTTAGTRAVPAKATVARDGKSVTSERGATLELHAPGARAAQAVTPREGETREGPPGVMKDERGTPLVKDEHGNVVTLGDFYRSGGSSNRAVSPNGKITVELVGALDKDRQGALGSDNRAPLAVVETAEGKGGPAGKYLGVVAAALSPDGQLLALGFQDGTILLWDVSPTR
jgi:WD40 repeat protein